MEAGAGPVQQTRGLEFAEIAMQQEAAGLQTLWRMLALKGIISKCKAWVSRCVGPII